MEAVKHNKALIAAVQDLYNKRIIKKDKDIVDKLGYAKGTVSGYISGNAKASEEFLNKFETAFGLSLSNYDEDLVSKRDTNPLPGTTIQDHITTLKQWREDIEAKYQDSNKRELALIAIINNYLKDLPNLVRGQTEMKEQQFADTEHLVELLAGLRQDLSTGKRVTSLSKKGRGISGQQPDNDGKNKGR